MGRGDLDFQRLITTCEHIVPALFGVLCCLFTGLHRFPDTLDVLLDHAERGSPWQLLARLPDQVLGAVVAERLALQPERKERQMLLGIGELFERLLRELSLNRRKPLGSALVEL